MGYFSDDSISEEIRRNTAFSLVNAFRESLTIARRTPQHIPYEKTLDFLSELDSNMYEEIVSLITKKNESEDVKYYKQIGEVKGIDPKILIQEDITRHEAMVGQIEDDTQIKKRITILKATAKYFEPRQVTENQMLNRDFSLAQRGGFWDKKLYETENIRDYSLPENRVLRMRLLHPDKFEHILGCDLIYEQFDLKNSRVRFIHIQYKAWNTDAIYFSSGNMKKQIQKMKSNVCDLGYCKPEKGNTASETFRFPYCSAFLRPTSKLQKPDSKMISTGHHVPICHALRLEKKDGKLSKENIKEANVGHKMFENLFIVNHLGSKWVSIDNLEKYYEEKGITSEYENIRVHVQEVMIETDAEKMAYSDF